MKEKKIKQNGYIAGEVAWNWFSFVHICIYNMQAMLLYSDKRLNIAQ